jgi:hypothetical protein
VAGQDRCLEVSKDELENIVLESTRTIEIDEFVPRTEIDDLYLVRPYYVVPDGKAGHDAYAVIRETILSLDRPRRSDSKIRTFIKACGPTLLEHTFGSKAASILTEHFPTGHELERL